MAEFKILKDNKEFKLNDRVLIEKTSLSETSYSLLFRNIEPSDIGQYSLTASNKCGKDTTQAKISVSGPAVIIRKPNNELTVAEKKSIKAEFEVNGIPMPEVEWFKNNEPLKADMRTKLENRMKTIHTITLDQAKIEDAAVYTLKAKNDSGEASESFTLIVQSKIIYLKKIHFFSTH